MGKMGAPEKLTPEVQKKIVLSVLRGAYVETAAQFAGISKETFYAWLKKGAKQKRGIYRDFSDAVEAAMAESEIASLDRIDSAARGREGIPLTDSKGIQLTDKRGRAMWKVPPSKPDWYADAWRLERRFPQRWGKRTQAEIQHSGKDGKALTVVDLVLSVCEGDASNDEGDSD